MAQLREEWNKALLLLLATRSSMVSTRESDADVLLAFILLPLFSFLGGEARNVPHS